MSFIQTWVACAIAGVALFLTAFVWAVRTRQFSELDRARYAPLEKSGPDSPQKPASLADRWALRALVILATAAILSAIILGLRSAR